MGDQRPILDYRHPPERRKATSLSVRMLYAVLAMPVTVLALVLLIFGARDAMQGIGLGALALGVLLSAVAARAWVPVFRGVLRSKSPLA
jgi:hypothetical protein